MNWIAIIGMILQFILGRVLPAPAKVTSQASNEREITEIAKAIHKAAPQIGIGCLLKVLPGFLSDLAKIIESNGLYDIKQLVDVALTHVTQLVRCQMGISAESMSEAQANEIANKVLRCGINAGLVYWQTRDAAAAINAFIACVFGGTTPPNPPNPPGDGGTNPNPPGDGTTPITPDQPTFRSTGRCGGDASQKALS